MKVVPDQRETGHQHRADRTYVETGFTHTGRRAVQLEPGVKSQLANMEGYAVAKWPSTSRPGVRRRRTGGGKFARGEGSRPGAETGPVCLTIKSGVGWEGGQGYASLTDTWNKTAEEKRILCHTTLVARGAKKDWVVASVDDRVGASSGIPEADPGWQPSHFQLTTTPERTIGVWREGMGECRKGGRDFGPNCTEEEAADVRGEGWRLMAMLP